MSVFVSQFSLTLRLFLFLLLLCRFVVQPSPKMLKFLELYREMERTHPHNRKMVCVSSSRVFVERIMGPWLDQIGIRWILFAGNGKTKQQVRAFTREGQSVRA